MERDLERDLEWESDIAASDGGDLELDRLLAGDGERRLFGRNCCCCCLEFDLLTSASFRLVLSTSLLSTPLESLCCLLRSGGGGLLPLCLLSRPDDTLPLDGGRCCGLGERELAESDLLSSVADPGLGDF